MDGSYGRDERVMAPTSTTAAALPPGWKAHWDGHHARWVYEEVMTGKMQWEEPRGQTTMQSGQQPQQPGQPPQQPSAPAPAPGGKRRAYAQSQAYYASDSTAQAYPQESVHQSAAMADNRPYQAPMPAQQAYPGYGEPQTTAAAAAAGSGLFTPGDPMAMQSPGYANGASAGYPSSAPGVSGLSHQYGQMNIGSAPAQQQQQQQHQQAPLQPHHATTGYPLRTLSLINWQPDVTALDAPPPAVKLPANITLTDSPYTVPDPSYQRCTLGAIPSNTSLLNKSRLPFALVLTPHRSLKQGDMPVPLIPDIIIARCRRCRTYINCYCTFVDGGNRWKCVMCNLTNDVPQAFDWDSTNNVSRDRFSRPELNYAAVEYTAPSEYMVRPPQPPAYVFLIDVTMQAVQSGLVATVARTILEALDSIPDADSRARVSLIAIDNALHFFSVAPGAAEATMLVMSDLEDVFLPQPNDLLVNLHEVRPAIESLLAKLSDMFADTVVSQSALGPGLQAAYKLLGHTGGKIVVATATLPSLGAGALKAREDPKLFNTAKESALLQPQGSFYKKLATDFSRAQISVDMFLFASGYQDVASLSCLPHYTSGETYYYPNFRANSVEDASKVAHELGVTLGSPIGLEAVIRVRASRGLKMSGFHGNFFVRSTDLLALPAVPQDQSYSIEFQLEENLTQNFVCFQTALLHTTSFGERRIRVITSALPVTQSLSDLYGGADQVAITTFLANKAVERALGSKLEDARDAIVNKVVDILGIYKSNLTSSGVGASGQLAICDNLKMLPLLMNGLLKNIAMRQSAAIPSDLRSYAMAMLQSMPSQMLIPYLHPKFYALHKMPPEAGTVGQNGIIMPPSQNLTSAHLDKHGLYLIDDGQNMWLYLGPAAVPQLCLDVFDRDSVRQCPRGKTTLPLLENPMSQRVNAIVAKSREMRRTACWQHLYVVQEDDKSMLAWFLSELIEDRIEALFSYQQFLIQLKDKVNSSSF